MRHTRFDTHTQKQKQKCLIIKELFFNTMQFVLEKDAHD